MQVLQCKYCNASIKSALSLMSCRGTSTECERSWKTLGHIISRLRNRLGPERARKLVKLYCHFHTRRCARARTVQFHAGTENDAVVLDEDGALPVCPQIRPMQAT